MGKTAKQCRRISVTEQVYAPPGRIDKDAAIIYGAKVLGRDSKNRRQYTDAALEEACQKYAGCRVNLSHPDAKTPRVSRDFQDQIGLLQSPVIRDDGVYADLHLLKSHPYTAAVLETAERWPDRVGLSHNVDMAAWQHPSGTMIVEGIPEVRSVDIVQKPATTSGIFEHEEPMKTLTVREVLESLQEKHPRAKRLVSGLEMDGMPDTAMGAMTAVPMADQAAGVGEMSPDDQIWQAFRAAIIAILDDDTLSIDDTISKMTDVLKQYQGVSDSTSTGDTSGDDTSTATESVMEQRIARLEHEIKARDALAVRQIQATPERIKAIAAMESEEEINALCAGFPKIGQQGSGAAGAGGSAGSKKPARSPALEQQTATGGANAQGASPKDLNSFMAGLRREG